MPVARQYQRAAARQFRTPPDLIHAHFAYPGGVAGIHLARQWGVPVVLTLHGDDVNTHPGRSARLRRALCFAVAAPDAGTADRPVDRAAPGPAGRGEGHSRSAAGAERAAGAGPPGPVRRPGAAGRRGPRHAALPARGRPAQRARRAVHAGGRRLRAALVLGGHAHSAGPDGKTDICSGQRGCIVPPRSAAALTAAMADARHNPGAGAARAARLTDFVRARYDVQRNAAQLRDMYGPLIAAGRRGQAAAARPVRTPGRNAWACT